MKTAEKSIRKRENLSKIEQEWSKIDKIIEKIVKKTNYTKFKTILNYNLSNHFVITNKLEININGNWYDIDKKYYTEYIDELEDIIFGIECYIKDSKFYKMTDIITIEILKDEIEIHFCYK